MTLNMKQKNSVIYLFNVHIESWNGVIDCQPYHAPGLDNEKHISRQINRSPEIKREIVGQHATKILNSFMCTVNFITRHFKHLYTILSWLRQVYPGQTVTMLMQKELWISALQPQTSSRYYVYGLLSYDSTDTIFNISCQKHCPKSHFGYHFPWSCQY